MSNTINHIKTAKGYSFNRFAKNVNLFYCEKLDIYATVSPYDNYLYDAGAGQFMIYAGEIVEAY